jgi:cytochrome c-type biogenesis protein CcmH/NrfF
VSSVRRLLLGLVVVAALTGPAVTQASAASDLNYTAVVSQFMCTTCHEPLELVSSPQAIAEKATLRGLIDRGLTMSEIKTAMVDQYGIQVLGKPPASGFNLSIYIVPPAVFFGGLALLAYTLPKWRRRARLAAEVEPSGAPPLAPEDARRLDDELTNFI